ncbi:U box domain-containing protein [Hirschfeldia incana]|nr:U box domain-containing protein [Hirschfeldia incana]
MGETFYSDVTYVAVNQDVRESTKTLLWTLKTLPVQKLCLLHVHIPFSLNPSSRLDASEINAIQQSELKTSNVSLEKYRDLCTNKGVINKEDVDISLISGSGVGEGIVKLINQKNIKKLVMGAAADPHYSRGMSITSRKAEYVSRHAPTHCKMWFICKGKLIKTREGSLDLGYPSDSFHTSSQKSNKGNKTNPVKEHFGQEQDDQKSNGSEADCAPKDFVCPISLEIMRDPHVAADGFTYEVKEIRKWINGGNSTSPSTGAKLSHPHLTPNYTLRSLIKDWLQHHPNYKH